MTAAAGQSVRSGTIAGVITDTTGAALPGVTVTLTGPALQVPQLVAEFGAGRQIGFKPHRDRRLDHMRECENRAVHLVARLQRVAAIGEQHRAVGEYDRAAGRAGEAGEPGKAFLGRRHVFILMTISAVG